MYFYLHFNLFITRFTSANLLYVSDMLWRMWKGAQRCLRRVVTVEPFYLIQTLSAVACSICPWNRFTVVIQSFHLCEIIRSCSAWPYYPLVEYTFRKIIPTIYRLIRYLKSLHYASQKTRTSFSKNMYVFPKKLVRVFLKAKTMPILLKK